MPAYHQWRSSRRAIIAYCSRSMRPQDFADIVHVVVRELGVDRQAQDLVRQSLGIRQSATGEFGIRRLKVDWERVMNVGAHTVVSQVRLEGIPPRRSHDKQVKHTFFRRQSDDTVEL